MSRKTVRKAIRLTPEMDEAIEAARGDVSWSRWVERALESALRVQTKAPELDVPTGANPSSTPTRAPASRSDAFRQATQKRR